MALLDLIQKYFFPSGNLHAFAGIQEMLINGLQALIFIHADGSRSIVSSPFVNSEQLVQEIQEFAYISGVRLDPHYPAHGGEYHHSQSSAALASFRWHAVIPPVSRDGPIFSLRKLSWEGLSLSRFGIAADFSERLLEMMHQGQSMVISGPTGAGKTSLLCQLLREVCLDERLIIVESLAEIPRMSSSWVRLCAQADNIDGRGQFSMQRIIEESLRLRPDRLLVGEIRGMEARSYYQALQVIDKGTLTSLHVHHPSQLIPRLSDLSGLAEDLWRQVFELHKILLLQMQRKTPRLREAFQYQSGEFRLIYSSDQT
ncbi:MAG: ATPase, T2SS/T4P/T4SS family [Oligoflexus sp.]